MSAMPNGVSGSSSGICGLSHSSWQDYHDEETILSCELKMYQNVMQIVMVNEDIRVSRMDCGLIVFYHEYGGELHVKEISPEDLIKKICRLWADLRGLMCFINWEHEPKCIFERIIKISKYETYREFFDEGIDYKAGYVDGKYTTDRIVPEWGVTNFDALTYLVNREKDKTQEKLNKV